jgi:hypothetical protein
LFPNVAENPIVVHEIPLSVARSVFPNVDQVPSSKWDPTNRLSSNHPVLVHGDNIYGTPSQVHHASNGDYSLGSGIACSGCMVAFAGHGIALVRRGTAVAAAAAAAVAVAAAGQWSVERGGGRSGTNAQAHGRKTKIIQPNVDNLIQNQAGCVRCDCNHDGTLVRWNRGGGRDNNCGLGGLVGRRSCRSASIGPTKRNGHLTAFAVRNSNAHDVQYAFPHLNLIAQVHNHAALGGPRERHASIGIGHGRCDFITHQNSPLLR